MEPKVEAASSIVERCPIDITDAIDREHVSHGLTHREHEETQRGVPIRREYSRSWVL